MSNTECLTKNTGLLNFILSMRKITITPGEYYHLYNRGNDKQNIFREDIDRVRFLFLILALQSPSAHFPQIGRNVSNFYKEFVKSVKHRVFDIADLKDRHVSLSCFALMPNHFHLLVYEKSNNGISYYMQRVLNAYTKYFNTKYEKSGHLFQGPYQIVHVNTNEQLLHLSAYIHLNPRDLKNYHNKEHVFPWSSYQDYGSNNRWGHFLETEIIRSQFKSKEEYYAFVKSSGAKNHPLLNENILLD
jgi:putative transposase